MFARPGVLHFWPSTAPIPVSRYKRGYKNVLLKGQELLAGGTDCALMMETSGHGAMADNHFLDDGAHSAVKVRTGGGFGASRA